MDGGPEGWKDGRAIGLEKVQGIKEGMEKLDEITMKVLKDIYM